MTQSKLPETSPETPNGPDPAADTEPLLHLHKMSTTAGLGSQEYVAINATAVVAVVFGLASALCILGYLLLIIPLIGIILSIVALRQIHNSNGTQTGLAPRRGVGLILAGGVTTVIGGYRGWDALQRCADQNAISTLCTQFGASIASGDDQQTYQLFSPDFQARVPLDQFVSRVKDIQQGGALPKIDRASWNGLADFQLDTDGVKHAVAMIKLHYTDTDTDDDAPRLEAHFARGPDGWRIDSIGDLFPEAPNPKPRR